MAVFKLTKHTTFPVGVTAVSRTATDASGNTASAGFTVTVVDTTPPVLTVPTDVTATATSVSGAVATYPSATALDIVAGILPATRTPASGATFALGQTTVTCTATDPSGNTGSASFHVSVSYFWSGVPAPFSADGSSTFKAGSTIPVKVTLTGTSASITNATIKLTYAQVTNGIEGPVMNASTNVASTTGNVFRYSGQEYIFNWSPRARTLSRWTSVTAYPTPC